MLTKGLERENGLLTEYESKKVLGAYAIPVNPTRQVESKQAARQTAHELGYPLAMKISFWPKPGKTIRRPPSKA